MHVCVYHQPLKKFPTNLNETDSLTAYLPYPVVAYSFFSYILFVYFELLVVKKCLQGKFKWWYKNLT